MQDPIKLICDDELERRWVWISLIMAFAIGSLLGIYAVANNLHPPSNVETIDSSRLHLTEEFAEDNLGVKENADGSFTVTMVAARYSFYPPIIEVPADTTVKFRIASADVLHGVHVPNTNATTMIVPVMYQKSPRLFLPRASMHFCAMNTVVWVMTACGRG